MMYAFLVVAGFAVAVSAGNYADGALRVIPALALGTRRVQHARRLFTESNEPVYVDTLDKWEFTGVVEGLGYVDHSHTVVFKNSTVLLDDYASQIVEAHCETRNSGWYEEMNAQSIMPGEKDELRSRRPFVLSVKPSPGEVMAFLHRFQHAEHVIIGIESQAVSDACGDDLLRPGSTYRIDRVEGGVAGELLQVSLSPSGLLAGFASAQWRHVVNKDVEGALLARGYAVVNGSAMSRDGRKLHTIPLNENGLNWRNGAVVERFRPYSSFAAPDGSASASIDCEDCFWYASAELVVELTFCAWARGNVPFLGNVGLGPMGVGCTAADAGRSGVDYRLELRSYIDARAGAGAGVRATARTTGTPIAPPTLPIVPGVTVIDSYVTVLGVPMRVEVQLGLTAQVLIAGIIEGEMSTGTAARHGTMLVGFEYDRVNGMREIKQVTFSESRTPPRLSLAFGRSTIRVELTPFARVRLFGFVRLTAELPIRVQADLGYVAHDAVLCDLPDCAFPGLRRDDGGRLLPLYVTVQPRVRVTLGAISLRDLVGAIPLVGGLASSLVSGSMYLTRDTTLVDAGLTGRIMALRACVPSLIIMDLSGGRRQLAVYRGDADPGALTELEAEAGAPVKHGESGEGGVRAQSAAEPALAPVVPSSPSISPSSPPALVDSDVDGRYISQAPRLRQPQPTLAHSPAPVPLSGHAALLASGDGDSFGGGWRNGGGVAAVALNVSSSAAGAMSRRLLSGTCGNYWGGRAGDSGGRWIGPSACTIGFCALCGCTCGPDTFTLSCNLGGAPTGSSTAGCTGRTRWANPWSCTRYWEFNDDVYCQACPDGHNCPGGTAGRLPCEGGKYCRGGRQYACPCGRYCPVGRSPSDAANPDAFVCPEGSYCPGDRADPIGCGGAFCPPGSCAAQSWTPSITPSRTPTRTQTASPTASKSAGATSSQTASITQTPSETRTPSRTGTPSGTATPTVLSTPWPQCSRAPANAGAFFRFEGWGSLVTPEVSQAIARARHALAVARDVVAQVRTIITLRPIPLPVDLAQLTALSAAARDALCGVMSCTDTSSAVDVDAEVEGQGRRRLQQQGGGANGTAGGDAGGGGGGVVTLSVTWELRTRVLSDPIPSANASLLTDSDFAIYDDAVWLAQAAAHAAAQAAQAIVGGASVGDVEPFVNCSSLSATACDALGCASAANGTVPFSLTRVLSVTVPALGGPVLNGSLLQASMTLPVESVNVSQGYMVNLTSLAAPQPFTSSPSLTPSNTPSQSRTASLTASATIPGSGTRAASASATTVATSAPAAAPGSLSASPTPSASAGNDAALAMAAPAAAAQPTQVGAIAGGAGGGIALLVAVAAFVWHRRRQPRQPVSTGIGGEVEKGKPGQTASIGATGSNAGSFRHSNPMSKLTALSSNSNSSRSLSTASSYDSRNKSRFAPSVVEGDAAF